MSAELHKTIRNEIDASRSVLEATLYAQEAGFDETPSRMIATAVSELVRNILKYAGSGELRLRRVKGVGGRGIEIEVIDRGPGIVDCESAMQDHVSSGGTLGLGLPGVERMMDEFSLESTPGEGTRVTARKWI
ncbi:MAG: ATP-binding protein [Deltaproteobacteria bacterium]|nr:ATP-binding protein [Deltaproteobacteria bacterium]MBW2418532.1 ATP-binding protein [Deltaproteobacteria bacterium]